MACRRISVAFAAAVLFALPMQSRARADTGAKPVEEVDFAISCGPDSQKAFKHAVWTLQAGSDAVAKAMEQVYLRWSDGLALANVPAPWN